ncbi:hypothetical protein ACWDRX_19040, partial [Streptomyces nigra]
MAFSCASGKNRPSGKHRKPGRFERTTARAAGVAALTATGVVGTLAAPALAAEPAVEQTGLMPVVAVEDTIALQIDCSPNSACSAPRATIMERVVQLGLETIPRGRIR